MNVKNRTTRRPERSEACLRNVPSGASHFAPAFAKPTPPKQPLRLRRLEATAGKLRTSHFFAFTLVELLVVVGIIVLLAGILIPAITMGLRLAEESRSQSRMNELAGGCEAYRKDYGYYPGQAHPGMLSSYTGSQVLGACLFGYNYNNINTYPLAIATPKYAPLKAEDLLNVNSRPNTISDQYGEAMAVLYYPARLDRSPMNQFVEADNSAYVTGDANGGWKVGYKSLDANGVTVDSNTTGFTGYIKDRKFDAPVPYLGAPNGDPNLYVPHGRNGFIMITAGVDRIYGTYDDDHYPQW